MSSKDTIRVQLTTEAIKVDQALAFVNSPYCGATNLFLGSTRINEKDEKEKQVECLIYEAYEEMALKLMHEVIEECLGSEADDDTDRYRVVVIHRLGEVRLAEVSLLIAISSPHRDTGHRLVMDMLNRIKERVPIWKKIVYGDENFIDSFNNWSMKSEAFWLSK